MKRNQWIVVPFVLALVSLTVVPSSYGFQGQVKRKSASVYPPSTQRAVVKALTHHIAALEVELAMQTGFKQSAMRRKSEIALARLKLRIEQLQPGGNRQEIRRETQRLVDEKIAALELQGATLGITSEEPGSTARQRMAEEALARLTKFAMVLSQGASKA